MGSSNRSKWAKVLLRVFRNNDQSRIFFSPCNNFVTTPALMRKYKSPLVCISCRFKTFYKNSMHRHAAKGCPKSKYGANIIKLPKKFFLRNIEFQWRLPIPKTVSQRLYTQPFMLHLMICLMFVLLLIVKSYSTNIFCYIQSCKTLHLYWIGSIGPQMHVSITFPQN